MSTQEIARLLTATVLLVLGTACYNRETPAPTELTSTAATSVTEGDDHWHNRAVMAMSSGRCEESIEILNARDVEPRNDIWSEDLIMANLACYMAGKGETFGATARQLAREATDRYPKSSVLAQVRGLVEQTMGDHRVAVEWYQRGKRIASENLAASPDGPDSHRDRAVFEQADRAIANVK